jgi:hypothetical protein
MRLYLINPSNPLVSIVKVKESRWNRYRVWKPLSLMVLAGLIFTFGAYLAKKAQGIEHNRIKGGPAAGRASLHFWRQKSSGYAFAQIWLRRAARAGEIPGFHIPQNLLRCPYAIPFTHRADHLKPLSIDPPAISSETFSLLL